jgi:ribose 5-phosphate isomerase B
MGRTVVTEKKVIQAAKTTKEIEVPRGSLVTPLAKDAARKLNVSIRFVTLEEVKGSSQSSVSRGGKGKVALGADHGGFTLKQRIKTLLAEMGYQVVDVGTNSSQPVDYPDFADSVARLVADGDCSCGIMIDGAGIGSSITANKVPGIRAALCHDVTSANNSREHNNANVLTLGARIIGEVVAEQIVRTWMTTPFEGGRHQSRINKITQVEKKYLKG